MRCMSASHSSRNTCNGKAYEEARSKLITHSSTHLMKCEKCKGLRIGCRPWRLRSICNTSAHIRPQFDACWLSTSCYLSHVMTSCLSFACSRDMHAKRYSRLQVLPCMVVLDFLPVHACARKTRTLSADMTTSSHSRASWVQLILH